MKHRLCAASALLGEPPPTGIANARRAVAHHAVAHEIDVGVVVVCRPMPMEIVKGTKGVLLRSERSSPDGRSTGAPAASIGLELAPL
jgi:hypothetical protein